MFNLRKFIISVFFILLSISAFAESKKVVIFYSSIGMGHLSAARAIEQNIKNKDPNAVVELKNIRDFMPKWKNYLDEKLFWLVVKKSPDTFDKMFKSKMSSTQLNHNYFDNISNPYSDSDVLKYLQEVNPSHIIATHYGSAETLIKLRNQGNLKNTPIAWLHTDYFQGYFPRISQHIEKTFLGMSELESQWKSTGLNPSKVATTGLPVNTQVFEPVDRVSFLTEQGLNPNIKTVVIASGGEGVGDFPTIVESMANKIKEPLQIVAICAKNEEHVKNLTALKEKLPSNVNLTIHGFVKNDLLLNYVKSSDLYITKSGGLSPTEGFAINKPIVLLDVYGGHERENADLFEKLGLAIVNRNQKNIGSDVYRLLNDQQLQEKMIAEQAKFRNSFNMEAITNFVMDSEVKQDIIPKNYGIENGSGVQKARESLQALNEASPSDIEIILSYGKSDTGKRFSGDTNPFGHIAIKIDNTVYTLNGRAKNDVEKELVFKTDLAEYLYGTQRYVENMEHTDAFGSSYARDNISIKVQGVNQSQKNLMLDYFNQIDQQFRLGQVAYHNKKFNCADLVKNALKKAGIALDSKEKNLTFPLDVLTDAKNYFEKDSNYKTEVVLYSRARNTENKFKQNSFPLSPYQFTRAIKTILSGKQVDVIENEVGKRISIGNSTPTAYYENLNGISEAEMKKEMQQQQDYLNKSTALFEEYEKRLESIDKTSLDFKFKSDQISQDLSIISKEYTVEELSNVINNQINQKTFPDANKRERAEKLYVGFKEWESLQKNYQSNMDLFIKTEMNYLIVGTYTTLNVLLADFSLRHPNIDKKRLQELHASAKKNYEKYLKSLEHYGKPADGPTRTASYRAFFDNAKEFIDLYQSYTNTPVLEHSKIKQIQAKTKRFFIVFKNIVKMTPEMTKVLFRAFFPDKASSDDKSLPKGIDELFQKFSKVFKIKTNIENKTALDNLVNKAKSGSKIVNIITPNHSHPIHDAVLMSSLNLPDYLLVMATDQIVSGKLANKVDQNKNIISVGRGSNLPIDKILEQLEKGNTNNIVIYPEGSVSAGIYETRPLREKFSYGLVNKLIAAGYEVNIVPVSYVDSARLLHKNSISEFIKESFSDTTNESMTLNAKVKNPIPPEITKAIMQSGNYDLLNVYIRQNWLDELGSSSKKISGLLKSKDLIKSFEQEFKINARNIHLNTNRCYQFYK